MMKQHKTNLKGIYKDLINETLHIEKDHRKIKDYYHKTKEDIISLRRLTLQYEPILARSDEVFKTIDLLNVHDKKIQQISKIVNKFEKHKIDEFVLCEDYKSDKEILRQKMKKKQRKDKNINGI